MKCELLRHKGTKGQRHKGRRPGGRQVGDLPQGRDKATERHRDKVRHRGTCRGAMLRALERNKSIKELYDKGTKRQRDKETGR